MPVSLPILLICLWVVIATAVAFLPMRWQYPPGIMLLIAAPILIGWVWIADGWLWGLAAMAGFVSMFRNPLIFFWKRFRGEQPRVPK